MHYLLLACQATRTARATVNRAGPSSKPDGGGSHGGDGKRLRGNRRGAVVQMFVEGTHTERDGDGRLGHRKRGQGGRQRASPVGRRPG